MLVLDETPITWNAEIGLARREHFLERISEHGWIAVTHDRYFPDNRPTRRGSWSSIAGTGIPWQGQLFLLAGNQKGQRLAQEERPRRTRLAQPDVMMD